MSLIANRSRTGSTLVTKDHFEFGQVLGEGAFGQVRLCKHKSSNVQYAAKILKKESLIKKNQTKYVKSERDILLMLNHPNVVRLFFTFADERRLYFIMELITGGEFLTRLKRRDAKKKEVIQYYMAELLEAIIYIHSKDIVHRDLKPENLLLAGDGHLKLVDFGIAKNVTFDGLHTFCGTAEYLAPELVSNKAYGKGVDWWAFGCVLYEVFCGKSPFHSSSMTITCQKIVERDIVWPADLPDDARDLIDKLLQIDVEKRLGCGPPNDPLSEDRIRKHKFFDGFKFSDLGKVTPPLLPDDSEFEDMKGKGINMSMYAFNGVRYSPEDEEAVINSRMVPLTNNHDDLVGVSALNLTTETILDSIRRTDLLRQMYPELRKLPQRPGPVRNFRYVNAENQESEDDEKDQFEERSVAYIQTVSNINSPVKCLSWSHNDKLAVAGDFCLNAYGMSATVSSNTVHTDTLQTEVTGCSANYLKFSPDGKYLAYDLQRQIGVVKQKGPSPTRTSTWISVPHSTSVLVGHKLPITEVAWANDSITLAAGGYDSRVYIWDAQKKVCRTIFDKHHLYISALSWQKSDKNKLGLLASGGGDGRVMFYDVNSGKVVRKLDYIHEHHSILGVNWCPTKENVIATYAQDRSLVFTDVNSWKPTKVIAHPTPVLQVEWSDNGQYLAAVHKDVIRIWDITAMKVLTSIPRDGSNSVVEARAISSANGSGNVSGGVNSIQLSFDFTSTRVACTTGNYDKVPVVFDVAANKFLLVQNTTTHKAPITALKWCSTRPILATGSFDHTVMLWGLDDGGEETSVGVMII